MVTWPFSAQGFVFATLLDRPLVPPIITLLWWFGIIPGPLAFLIALSDGLSSLWTFSAWRRENAADASAT